MTAHHHHLPKPPIEARPPAARSALLVMALVTLSACAVGPDFVRPEPPAAERMTRDPLPAATLAADGHAQTFTPGAEIPADWWMLFRSPGLDAAVRQALTGNPTLKASLESLRQSQDN